MNGPPVRTDIVYIYVFRDDLSLLQLQRTNEDSMPGTWQPVMGSIETGETAPQAAVRELREETGLDAFASPSLGFWSLGRVFAFYIVRKNTVFMPPSFACKVDDTWTPALNHEHADFRWVEYGAADREFIWPDQRAAIRCLAKTIAIDSPTGDFLRISKI